MSLVQACFKQYSIISFELSEYGYIFFPLSNNLTVLQQGTPEMASHIVQMWGFEHVGLNLMCGMATLIHMKACA